MCQHQQQAGTPYPNSTVFSLIRSSAHTQNPPKPPHQRKMRHNRSILAHRHLSTGICQEPSSLQLPKSSWSPNKTSHGTRLCSRIDAASADGSQQHPLAAPSPEGVWVPKAPPSSTHRYACSRSALQQEPAASQEKELAASTFNCIM